MAGRQPRVFEQPGGGVRDVIRGPESQGGQFTKFATEAGGKLLSLQILA